LRRDSGIVNGLGKAVRMAFVDCRHGLLLAIDKRQDHTGCCELWPWTLTKRCLAKMHVKMGCRKAEQHESACLVKAFSRM
jgi:hypothetical protein